MNAETDILSPASDAAPAASISRWRLFLWSLRRELWEHRYIYIAPPTVASLLLISFVISTWQLPGALREAAAGVGGVARFMSGYSAVAFVVMVIGYLASVFYCLEALQGEKRDRSILFWKSLPVSDAITVLAKAVIPLVVVPVVIFGTVVAFNLVMVGVSTLVVIANGINPAELWSRLSVALMWAALLQGLTFMTLWFAPLWAWLLMVSAWARRMAFIWAIAPVVALTAFDHVAFSHYGVYLFVERRLAGGFGQAFSIGGQGKTPINRFEHLDPVRLFTNPELWVGVIVAVLFLYAAIRLRRSRAPL
jgi:ABC-2 type transport system permease protein